MVLNPMQTSNKCRSQVSSMFAVFLLLCSLEIIKSQFLVKTLPGLVGDLPFTLETGYIAVGESDDVQLFYYFIESEMSPEDDPLILWISGGPGCSSVIGLIYEIGPLTFNSEISTVENPILEIVPDSLTKAANIIFLDQPAGSGFSYAKVPEVYIMNDTLSAKQTYNFLEKWLLDHPKFLNNPLYLGGDSYTGIVLPMIVQEINYGNEAGERPQINIKGYLLGNPATDIIDNYNARIQFAHRMGLLSDEIYKSTKEHCHGDYVNINPNNSLCIHDLQVVDKSLRRIKMAHILEPACRRTDTIEAETFIRGVRADDKTSVDILPQVHTQSCREESYSYTYAWANHKDVREALHIREEFGDTEWVQCNQTLHFPFDMKVTSYTNNVPSSVGYHQNLTHKKCRALIYSGDHDMLVPYLGTLKWVGSLNLSVVDDWRPWLVDEQVAGYTMKYSKGEYNLTFATVKGGGHTAPEYKHKECITMLMRWLANDTVHDVYPEVILKKTGDEALGFSNI